MTQTEPLEDVLAKIDATSIRPISETYPHVFLIVDRSNREYILKTMRSDPSRLLMLRSKLTFAAEIDLLIELDGLQFCELLTPRVRGTDRKTYVLQERIMGACLKRANEFSGDSVARALCELHVVGCAKNPSLFQRTLHLLFWSVGASVTRGALRLGLKDPFAGVRAFLLFTRIWLRTVRQPFGLLHHRDLVNHENSLLTSTGKLALIDFGQARLERRWVLMDGVDLSFDYDLNCHHEILRSCIFRLREICPKRFVAKDQVRIALLRRLLHPSRFYGLNAGRFLHDYLLCDRQFDRWFAEALPHLE